MVELMPKYAFSYPSRSNIGKGHLAWKSLQLQVSQADACTIFPLKSSFDISRKLLFQEMAEFSTFPMSTALEHQLFVRHCALNDIWHITVPTDSL
jgi:hypothetical protein